MFKVGDKVRIQGNNSITTIKELCGFYGAEEYWHISPAIEGKFCVSAKLLELAEGSAIRFSIAFDKLS